MVRVRERPRMVVAQVLAVVVILGVGVAVGAVADDPNPELPLRSQAKLKRTEIVSGERADRVDRTNAVLRSVRNELDETLDRGRSLTRTNSRLRRDLRSAKRALLREQRDRRSRSRSR